MFQNRIVIDKLNSKQNISRKLKVKKMAATYHYQYKIVDGIVYIGSRYDYWTIILSDNKEHLFHKNSIFNFKTNENNKTEYHLQGVYENLPTTIFRIFRDIEAHDRHVLESRIFRKFDASVDITDINV